VKRHALRCLYCAKALLLVSDEPNSVSLNVKFFVTWTKVKSLSFLT